VGWNHHQPLLGFCVGDHNKDQYVYLCFCISIHGFFGIVAVLLHVGSYVNDYMSTSSGHTEMPSYLQCYYLFTSLMLGVGGVSTYLLPCVSINEMQPLIWDMVVDYPFLLRAVRCSYTIPDRSEYWTLSTS